MIVHSLARITDQIFAQFSGKILDRGAYSVVMTPGNLHFMWGNCLVFERRPRQGNVSLWRSIFAKEFSSLKGVIRHELFTWDSTDPFQESGDVEEFLNCGFCLDEASVLLATTPTQRRGLPPSWTIRRLSSDRDWQMARDNQIRCSEGLENDEGFRSFKTIAMKMHREQVQAGFGDWWGLFLEERLVSDLGLFFADGRARYQSIGTDPNHRRKGFAGGLIVHAAQMALQEEKALSFVMEVEAASPAERLYLSLGFQRVGRNFSLSRHT